MLNIPNESRGKADHGWLKSWHTFSFADYYDPARMGFGALRVINDDIIDPGMGFGTHPHRDMEIITIPLSGALKHADSVGNSTVIKRGEVQLMSAGTGIRHSEFNASNSEEVRLLQIWVHPRENEITPRYDQKSYELKKNELSEIVSPEGGEHAVKIIQDAWFSLGNFDARKSFTYSAKRTGNGVFVFVLSGEAKVQGQTLGARDALGVNSGEEFQIEFTRAGEVLLMDIPLI